MKRAAGLAFLLTLGCAPVGIDVGSGEHAIVNGTRERNRPAVLYIINAAGGGACTASLIAPRAVLTAKHCVNNGRDAPAAPNNIYVLQGDSTQAANGTYRVTEVRVVPGNWQQASDGNDVAMLILRDPINVTPMQISRDNPSTLAGGPFTAVGFGQTPAGQSGVKYSTMSTVEGVQGGLIFVDPAVCSGDSGGPIIGPDDKIYGVASFIYSPDGMSEPSCGTAPGAYTAIYRHLDFIDEAVRASGTCVPTSPATEVCDARDNDCNGQTDETCLANGAPCERDDQCRGLLCATLATGARACSETCDPLQPTVGCGADAYCARGDGCAGFCVTGTAGSAPFEAPCTADTDCATLYCADPGDGVKRCLASCRADVGLCLSGEKCVAVPGACGPCVSAEIVEARRDLGEPCTADGDCASASCRVVAPATRGECTRACTVDRDCGTGFRCLAQQCARGQAEGVGGVCRSSQDCVSNAVCAMSGDRGWCTTPCSAGDACPRGLTCQAVGSTNVCVPALALLGEACMSDADCTTGLCDPATSRCGRLCSAAQPCPSGFGCVRTAEGTGGVCESTRPAPVTPMPMARGSCAATQGAPSPWAALGLLSILGAALSARRRRAR